MDITTSPTPKDKKPIGRAPNYSPEYYMMMAQHIVKDGLSYWEASKSHQESGKK